MILCRRVVTSIGVLSIHSVSSSNTCTLQTSSLLGVQEDTLIERYNRSSNTAYTWLDRRLTDVVILNFNSSKLAPARKTVVRHLQWCFLQWCSGNKSQQCPVLNRTRKFGTLWSQTRSSDFRKSVATWRSGSNWLTNWLGTGISPQVIDIFDSPCRPRD